MQTHLRLVQEDEQNITPCCERNINQDSLNFENEFDINEEEGTRGDYIQVPTKTLSISLRLLFGQNGATLALPMMAFMSLINDRIAIPPAYLSVYGAVSFLPYSFKPIYGTIMTTKLFSDFLPRHVVISILLLCSSLSFLAFAYLPAHAVVPCIFLGFLNGIFTSWPEFLLGIALLDTAKDITLATGKNRNARMDEQTKTKSSTTHDTSKEQTPSEEDVKFSPQNIEKNRDLLLSAFQSQAATTRNLGSMSASCITFVFFICQGKDHQQISDRSITFLFTLTSFLPLLGSFVAWKYRVGNFSVSSLSSSSLQQASSIDGSADTAELSNETVEHDQFKIRRKRQKDNVAYQNICENSMIAPDYKAEPNNMLSCFQTRHMLIMSIALFQITLIWGCLRTLIVSISSSMLWIIILSLLLITFSLLCISIISQNRLNRQSSTSSSTKLRPELIAVFLILRHSMPSAYPLGSYFYSIFQKNPIYLQITSLIGGIIGTLSTWTFEKIVSNYDLFRNELKGMKIFIATITILTSALSLLQIPFINLTREDSGYSLNGPSNPRMSFYVYHTLIGFVSSFLGELWFMPSVILATTAVNWIDEQTCHKIHTAVSFEGTSDNETGYNNVDNNERITDNSNSETHNSHHMSFEALNEGIQYSILISCIDFGDQISDWIDVPIVSSLGISRENGWQHLNSLIILCFLVRIISLLSLFLLRTKRNK